MSKQLSIPENDILRKYRIAALTTPIAAYEMTNLDKAMSDILIKKDIPRDKKLKLYYEALNNFIDVRDIYLQRGVSDIMDTTDLSHSSSHPDSSSVLPTFASLSSSSPLTRTPAAASSPVSMIQETNKKKKEKEDKEEEEEEESGVTPTSTNKKKKRLSLASILGSKIQKKKIPTRLMIEKNSRKKKEKKKYLQFC